MSDTPTSPAVPDRQARRATGPAAWLAAFAALVVGLVLLVAAGNGLGEGAYVLRFVGCVFAFGSILLWPRLGGAGSDEAPERVGDVSAGDATGDGDARPAAASAWTAPLKQALAAVLVVGIGVRLLIAITEPMHYDEAFTVAQYSSKGFLDALTVYDAPNNHILHSLLVRVCLLAFGESEFSIRLPVFLAGASTIAAVAWLSARLASPRVAVIAAALVAVSPPLIVYGSMARGYAIAIALFVVMLAIGHRIATEEAVRRRAWFVFALVSALGLLTVPTAALGVAGGWLWTVLLLPLLGRLSWAPIVRFAWAGVVVAAAAAQLYLPVSDQPGFDLAATSNPARQLAGNALEAWSTGWGTGVAYAILALAALGFVVARREWRSQPAAITLALAVLAMVPVFTQILGQLPPFVRTYIYLVPLLLIGTAAGLAWLLSLGERRLPGHLSELLVPTLALVVLLPVLVIGARPQVWDLDPRRIADPVDVIAEAQKVASDVPLLIPGYTQIPYAFYVTRDKLTYPYVVTLDPRDAPQAILPVTPPGDLDEFLGQAQLMRDQVDVKKVARLDRQVLYLVTLRPGAVVAAGG